jgi:hypothetical protein
VTRALRHVVATVVIAALVVAATAAPAPASRARISAAGCDAFADYFTIEFLVAFASAFAGLGDELGTDGAAKGKKNPVTKEDIQDVFHLVFSPKLEAVTATLAREAPKSIRGLFARQRDVFARGVHQLAGIGLTKRQLAALAKLDLKPDTDIKSVLGDVDLPKAELTAAAREFGKHADDLDLNDVVSKDQQRDFQRTGATCGVFPVTGLDCKSLVSTDLTRALVGGTAKVTNDQGTCTYAGPKDPGGDEPVMMIDVYKTPRAFGRLVEQLQGGESIDEDTHLSQGFSTFSSTKTCGKTLYGRTSDSTVVIAVCAPNDGDIDTARLEQARDEVVAARSILGTKSG